MTWRRRRRKLWAAIDTRSGDVMIRFHKRKQADRWITEWEKSHLGSDGRRPEAQVRIRTFERTARRHADETV